MKRCLSLSKSSPAPLNFFVTSAPGHQLAFSKLLLYYIMQAEDSRGDTSQYEPKYSEIDHSGYRQGTISASRINK